MSTRTRIVGDERIAFLKESLADLGILRALPAPAIINKAITGSDILIVRSVTRVDEQLLRGTSIRFVGTATSGFDHIDRNYLRRKKIKFAYAPGSNAKAVAEYVTTSLLCIAEKKNIKLSGRTIGVIGVGHVGRLVVKKCMALGMHVLMNDPPLQKRTGSRRFVSLEKIFTAGFITLHVPLTYRGIYATHHMVNDDFLARVKNGTILINTSRGPVVDESAVLKYRTKLGGIVFDVWENEPDINPDTIAVADIGTPHIAGYTLDAKVRATGMIYKRLIRYLGMKKEWTPPSLLEAPVKRTIRIDCRCRDDEQVIREAVFEICDPEKDTEKLRGLLKLPARSIGKKFESLRNNYHVRREFFNYRLLLSASTPLLRWELKELGFADIEG